MRPPKTVAVDFACLLAAEEPQLAFFLEWWHWSPIARPKRCIAAISNDAFQSLDYAAVAGTRERPPVVQNPLLLHQNLNN